MNRILPFLLVAPLVLYVGCSSGNKSQRCSFDGQTILGDFPWPRFRADMANTGHTTTSLANNGGGMLWSFQLTIPVSIGSSPIVGMDQVIFGSSDGQMHVLSTDGGTPDTDFTNNLNMDATVRSAITAGALVGANGNVFIATGDGRLIQTDSTGNLVEITSIGGFINASPNIGTDGEIYVMSASGAFAAVCPNGVSRFLVNIAPSLASAAIATNQFCNDPAPPGSPSTVCPRIIVTGNDSQVRAYDILGRQDWAFFASAPVVASVVLAEPPAAAPGAATNVAFVADTAGRVFAIGMTNGTLLSPEPFTAPGSITASPALLMAGDTAGPVTLYVADQTGVVTAVEANIANSPITFSSRVVFDAGAPISSSPAVATGGTDPVIVFGADRFVYAVTDDQSECTDHSCNGGANAGESCETNNDCALLWKFDAHSQIGSSSPAIDSNGTVYIGTQGGTLYAINGTPVPDTPTPSPTPTPPSNPTPTTTPAT